MEGIFVVPTLCLLAFLPVPPRGPEIVSFAVLSVGIAAAGCIWWGLRSPTRLAWGGAMTLSVAWLGSSIGFFAEVGRLMIAGATGHSAADTAASAYVSSLLFASVPVMTQAVVLVAWLRGNSLARTAANDQ